MGAAGRLKSSTDRASDSGVFIFEGEQDDWASQKGFKPLSI